MTDYKPMASGKRNIISERMLKPEEIKKLNKGAFDALQKAENNRKGNGDYIFRVINERPEDVPNFYQYLPWCFLLGMTALATFGLLKLMEKL